MKTIFNFLFLLFPLLSYAQFVVSSGATVTIMSGATLKVESNIQNNAGGSITNNGNIEVTGHLINDGTMINNTNSTIKFIGVEDSNFKSNGSTVDNLIIEKSSADVVLLDELNIANQVTFTNANNSKILLDAHNMNITNPLSSTVVGAGSSTGYIVASSSGKLSKAINGNSTKVLEIGDANNYTPIQLDVTGNSYALSTISGHLETTEHPNRPALAPDYINRFWKIEASNIGGFSADVEGTYVADDVVGTASNIFGAIYDQTNWSYTNSTGAALSVGATASQSTFSLSGFSKLTTINLKAYLSGAMPSSGTTMSTVLRTNNLIPGDSPYVVAPFNAPAESATTIPSNVTDWILVELRSTTNPATILAQRSGFILNDGSIIDNNGDAGITFANAPASAFVALRHRNHLSIRTKNPMNLINPPTLYNFSEDTIWAYTNVNLSNPNMRLVNGVYTLWGGDVNNDGQIRFLTQAVPPVQSDAVLIWTIGLGGIANGQTTNYSKYDINFDRYTRYLTQAVPPIQSDALLILTTTLGGVANATIRTHL